MTSGQEDNASFYTESLIEIKKKKRKKLKNPGKESDSFNIPCESDIPQPWSESTLNQASVSEDSTVVKKKKKKKRKESENENVTLPVDDDANKSNVVYESQGLGGKVKKKEVREKKKSIISQKTPNNPCKFNLDSHVDSDRDHLEDSVKNEKKKIANDEASMSMVKIKPEVLSEISLVSDAISRKQNQKKDKKKIKGESEIREISLNSDEKFTISNAVKMSSKNLENFSGQILAVVKWILSQDIKVSALNMKYKRNQVFDRSEAVDIVEEIGTPMRFFTEAEDEEILLRLKFLEKSGVIESAPGLCEELKQGRKLISRKDKDRKIHKHTFRIIGLYLCQNLTNRLAFYTTERMLGLVNKLTASPKPAKMVTVRRPWTLDDDKIIVKSVLLNDILKK